MGAAIMEVVPEDPEVAAVGIIIDCVVGRKDSGLQLP